MRSLLNSTFLRLRSYIFSALNAHPRIRIDGFPQTTSFRLLATSPSTSRTRLTARAAGRVPFLVAAQRSATPMAVDRTGSAPPESADGVERLVGQEGTPVVDRQREVHSGAASSSRLPFPFTSSVSLTCALYRLPSAGTILSVPASKRRADL